MDLREFIEETVSSIADATTNLRHKYEPAGLVIDPPISPNTPNLFSEGDYYSINRRVSVVEFDVAVTANQESEGSGKTGFRLFVAEASLDGGHARRNEQVSHVRFSLPIALPASSMEKRHREKLERHREENERKLANHRQKQRKRSV